MDHSVGLKILQGYYLDLEFTDKYDRKHHSMQNSFVGSEMANIILLGNSVYAAG